MKKKLPIGLSDFRKMIEENYYYVDKSLFIKEVLDAGSEAILLPRPRRFGKTLNLSMLRYFYEKTEEDMSGLFRHLAIWRQGESYTCKQGQHPVIYLTFKDVKCSKWEDCGEQLKIVIAEEYKRHDYVLNEEWVKPDDREEYRGITGLAASDAVYQNSLKKLSAYLSRHYGTKTVILIDEYDTPIQGGYMNGYYPQVIEFMRNVLSGALKDNIHLEKAVLTGILRVAKESIFSGLNNLDVYSLLVPDFSTWFGLLEHEVEAMLKEYGIESEMEEVKSWYNGYVFGDSVIYNPWSIINYVDKWSSGFRPYWVNTSGNELIRQLVTRGGAKVKEELETLIQGGSIEKTVDDNVVFGDIGNSSDTMWSFLLFSGYLKPTEKEYRNKRLYCTMQIPNCEVEYLYEEIIFGWFEQSRYGHKYEMLLKSLLEGDLETFEGVFQELIMQTFSYFDTGGDEPESVYHAFVLGLLVSLRDTYEVVSNRESGYGRHDVVMIPKGSAEENRHRKGFVLEFKKVNAARKETLEQAADAALRQIEDKRYAEQLRARGVDDIVQLGIAFKGKEIRIKF